MCGNEVQGVHFVFKIASFGSNIVLYYIYSFMQVGLDKPNKNRTYYCLCLDQVNNNVFAQYIIKQYKL